MDAPALSFLVGMILSKFFEATDAGQSDSIPTWRKIAALVLLALLWSVAMTIKSFDINSISFANVQQIVILTVITVLGSQTWHTIAIKLPQPWQDVLNAVVKWLTSKQTISAEALKTTSIGTSQTTEYKSFTAPAPTETAAAESSPVYDLTVTSVAPDNQGEVDAGHEELGQVG